jgi:hypothetical protein
MQADHKVVTKKSILLAYQMLRGMEPFCNWKLPTAIETKVVNDASLYGCFETEPNMITISTARVWDVSQLIATVAHEMIHLRQHKLKQLSDTNPHDAFFMEQARIVCIGLGFDKEHF